MKKMLYGLIAWVLLTGLATAGYSQDVDSTSVTDSSSVPATKSDDTNLLILTSVLGVYALVLSYLYFVEARPKLRKRAGNTRSLESTVEPTPSSILAEKQLSQQVAKLRREVRELEELMEKQEIEMERMRLELKNRPATPPPKPTNPPEPAPASLKPALPPVTRFYLATPNSDGSFVNNPAPQFDPSRSLYEFELNGAGTEANFCFASDAATIANALSHPDRYLIPACLYSVPPATARNIRTTTPGKARLSPDGQRWIIEQKAQILFE